MAFAEAGMGIIGSNAYRAPEIIIGTHTTLKCLLITQIFKGSHGTIQ